MTAESSLSPRTQKLKACPVCESSRTRTFFSSQDRLHGVPGLFSYDLCEDCDSVFQNPMVVPEDLHLCYPTDYSPYNLTQEVPDVDFTSLPTGNIKQRLRSTIVSAVRDGESSGLIGVAGRALSRSRFARERAFYGLVIDECLPKGKGPHNALDLGCGSGWLMQKLKTVGWDVEGLEWNADAAELAQKITGCNVWSGDFFDADLPTEKYQLIVLNHVFEHFSHPVRVLDKIRTLLADDGIAVLFFPNPHSSGARKYRASWFPWEVPRHLVLPSVKAMDILARRSGFRSSRTRARAYYSEVHWARSKAYVVGRHPESDAPELEMSEKIGVTRERVASTLGFDTGWEVVSVLRK